MIRRALNRLRLPREAGSIVALFVAFRLMMLIALRPDHLTFFGDYPYCYELARLSDRGLWPYLNYWMEYPPIFPFLSTLIYRLIPSASYDSYVVALGAVMTLFGAGNLILLMRLAARLHGDTAAIRSGWVYALLFAPLVIGWWQFDAMMAFFFLLALDRLLAGRDAVSAAAAGLGVVVKIIPILILPAVALVRPMRRAVAYAAIVIALIAIVYAPLLIAAPDMMRASLSMLSSRTSYETVWALIDGNLTTGLLGGVDIHLDPAQAGASTGNPPRIPDGLKAIGFGAAYLALLRRLWPASGLSASAPFAALRGSSRDASYRIVGVTAITFVFFALWSSGWSPQWQMTLIPLALLMLPDGSGIGFVLIFSLVNLAEWPVLISRGLWSLVVVTILLRTLLLVVLVAEMMRRMRGAPARPGGRFA